MSEIQIPGQNPFADAMGVVKVAAQRNNLAGVVNGLSGALSIHEQGLQRLFQLLIGNNKNTVELSIYLEVHRLMVEMITKILVSKNIITQEELDQLKKTDVEEVMKKQQEEAEKHAEAAREEIKKKVAEAEAALKKAEAPKEEPKEACENPQPESDVQLPSEKNNVVVFPSPKKEE